MTPGAGPSATATATFRAFFGTWLLRHQSFLDELLQVTESTGQNDAEILVTRVLAHYKNYYAHKTRLANANAFVVFNPPWFSPLEKTYLWVSGFKPALIIRVVYTSVNDLTAAQTARLEKLNLDSGIREQSINDALAKIQEGMASPEWVRFSRRWAGPESGPSSSQHQPVDGEVDEVGDAMEVLKQRLAHVVRDADRLRVSTTESIVEILNPYQSAKLFIAFARLFFRIRALGAEMEAQRGQQQQEGELALDTNGW